MPESFQPIHHSSPDSFLNKIALLARLCLDMQFSSLYRQLFNMLPKVKGKLLDVGCGNSPFKHLLNTNQTSYIGIDYDGAKDFNYKRDDVVYFDGTTFPFENESFDFVLCTEVLEHISEPQKFINEIYRVLNNNGAAIFSVPWSARFHYIPYDYFRYTPTTLHTFFEKFTEVKIIPRGTDITAIASKIIVVFARNINILLSPNSNVIKYILTFVPVLFLLLVLFPILILAILIGQFSLLFKFGSFDDCLGYTIVLKK